MASTSCDIPSDIIQDKLFSTQHPPTKHLKTMRQKSRNLFLVLLRISIATFLLFPSVESLKHNPNDNTLEFQQPHQQLHIHKHLQVAHSTCEGTLYPELCVSTLASFPDLSSKSIAQMISATINATASEVSAASSNCSGLKKTLAQSLGPLEKRALDDCLQLFAETVEEFKTVVSELGESSPAKRYNDMRTFLSGAMTNQYTCLDGFAYSKKHVRDRIEKSLNNISKHVSNSLAMLKKIPGVKESGDTNEVLPAGYGKVKDGFPTWMSTKDRKLLQTSVSATMYDLIVAQDGTGNYTTVSAAVAAAPNSSTTRFVIYIKAGAYFENVEVISKKTNLMFLGDGIGKTIIKAYRNVVDGWTTFQSATVAVVGSNFIAKGITIENGAGPSKHQAVALRSGSDFSAFYQCSFVGYQDTLYVHSLRQFYSQCDIYGTVDFIFGNAAAVIQNCSLYARKPNENQKNLYTAQGREDPNQNTGISILGCKVAAATDLIPVKSDYPTYLGRPWKEYSRTVFMLSYIEDVVVPAGWLEWDGSFALSTLYYGEYQNRGPGSNTSGRVTWPGYRVINSSTEASQFTVANFIQGTQWLNNTGISYYLGLTG